jgi:hypothetical protein
MPAPLAPGWYHRARRVAPARRCAPLTQIPTAARRLQAAGRQGRNSGSARRRLPRTTRDYAGGAAPQRAARPVASRRLADHSFAAARRFAFGAALVLTPNPPVPIIYTNARPRAGGCVSAPVTPPAIAARLGRLRQVSRPLLHPSPPLRVLARFQYCTRRHSAGCAMARQAPAFAGGYAVKTPTPSAPRPTRHCGGARRHDLAPRDYARLSASP